MTQSSRVVREPRVPDTRAPHDVAAGRIAEMMSEALPLAILAMAMLYTDRLFTFIDDEAIILTADVQPVRVILQRVFSGATQHPPLYDLWLHAWLWISHGAFAFLRAPSMVFFVLGLWLLSRAARYLGGEPSAAALLWMAMLWPYGFHYGRLVESYSFTFFLIAALSWAYLRFQSVPTRERWAVACAFALALVYTNYAGWALLALLAADDCFRNRRQARTAITRLLATAVALLVLCAPLWRPLIHEYSEGVDLHRHWGLAGLNAGYSLYSLFVSESVAPWFWRFSVPATIAVAVSLLMVFFSLRGAARRLLLFAVLLLAAMDVAGMLQAKFLFLIAPWFVLPIAVALGTIGNRYWRAALAISLAIAAGIGWYGIYSKHYYAQEQFVEPWAQLSAEAARAAQDGAIVIGNKPVFFLYLTYDLKTPQTSSSWRFSGTLPDEVRNPQIWSASNWESQGHPTRPYMLLVQGTLSEEGKMDEAGKWLDEHCGDRVVRHLVRETGSEWKKRLFSGYDIFWRIETRQYACDEGGISAPPQGSGGSPDAPHPR